MPKKTKKQKIKAELRRKEFLLKQEKIQKTAYIPAKTNISEISTQPSVTTDSKESNLIKDYFKQDLKKSLIIILAIIALEIVIYFGTIIKYFK
ncbi:MAG: hypothetical protein ABH812_00385 [bacterium]